LTAVLQIVTGGGSGIGRPTALIMMREGATVVVADRDPAGTTLTCSAAENRRRGARRMSLTDRPLSEKIQTTTSTVHLATAES
jgi:NAD(P)-dependent dehydrogenase (short-subunit alcohol dehydrogenase family)